MTPQPIESRTEETLLPVNLARLAQSSIVLGCVHLALLGLSWVVLGITRNALFAGMAAYLLWCVLLSFIDYIFLKLKISDLRQTKASPAKPLPEGAIRNIFSLRLPGYSNFWQWALMIFGGSLLIFEFVFRQPSPDFPLKSEMSTTLRAMVAVYLFAGCALSFITNYAHIIHAKIHPTLQRPILQNSRLTVWLCFSASALLFIFTSFSKDFSSLPGWILLNLTFFFVIESVIRMGLRIYQPKSKRSSVVAGASVLLGFLKPSGEPSVPPSKKLKEFLGFEIHDMWIVRFFRQTALYILLGGVALGWFSTCFTAVPLGSRGVLVQCGTYHPKVLQPGLHLSQPWPFSRIKLVQTEKIRTVTLGFDKDLNTPILWNEPHVQGEKNLLVGDGEALLTINLPILYKITDPVAYLLTAKDPEKALSDLAERRLLHVIASRDSFSVMLGQRSEIADTLKRDLQEEVDRLHLGLGITFVGLQDIHPPVSVAGAYQDVISAEEEKLTLIDTAKARRARTIPNAQATAQSLLDQASAQYDQRVFRAQGEAARFLALSQEDKANSELLRTRMRLEALVENLPKTSITVLGIPAAAATEFSLDLRNQNPLSSPLTHEQ